MESPLPALPTWVLSSAAARSHQIIQRRLGANGFTGYEYRCLAALAGEDRVSQAVLGGATALDPRDVTHTVRGLEQRGLVERDKDPDHGRRILVSLTPHGRDAASSLIGVMAATQDEVFAGLSKGECATLLALLARIARTDPQD
ncbi:MarR family winged helix-turn-helix transcriptional regulator [Nocardioides sp.]|uniref:MarR family winged helix-turn-helix transcriptional regulator n=1 Tax=Nocardioides sp. TaxID=35761 RepID=UPI002737287A|nr:MarR family winged helix-turn-helix transcriptional regulator [Nocardioides sp.]MDP3890825.1 MarR family winged helix-turn-helix transcriptional regulator [Nocardioides sp.]